MTDKDYEARAKQFGFASEDDIRNAIQQSGTIVLDVRTTEEIGNDGTVVDLEGFPSDIVTFVQSDCTPDDCYTLRTSPQDIIPNITTNTATIVVYCRSGRRASNAKSLLLQHGYQGTILNAGGYSDIKKFF
jgi:rhodanese-related sulfurtransferase